MGVIFDTHPVYQQRWLNKVGGVLVLAALVIGATGKFIPYGATALTLGFVLFALGVILPTQRGLHR
jgi:hypothetical protein